MHTIIPARSEEKNLEFLIHSLKHQTLKPLEVIVVDDHSEDGTAGIAGGEDCIVLRSEDLPERWAGKPWACRQGANKAAGDILLFDMKTGYLPALILVSMALAAAANGLGLLVTALGKTEAQVNSLSVLFAITLAALAKPLQPSLLKSRILQKKA